MFIAILLDRKPWGEGVFRTIFLYPMSLSFIVSGTIWRWLLAPQGGVNILPTYLGFKPFTFQWLSSKGTILEFDWQNLLQVLLYLAAAVLILGGLYVLRDKPRRALKGWLLPRRAHRRVHLAVRGHAAQNPLDGRAARFQPGYHRHHHRHHLAIHGLHHGLVPGRVQRHFAGSGGRGAAGRRQRVRLLPPCGHSHAQTHHHQRRDHSLAYFTQDVRPDLRHDRTGQRRNRTPGPEHVPDHLRANDFAKGAAIAVVLFMVAALFIIPYLVSSYRQKRRNA